MTIQIARRIGRALSVRSATRIKELDTALLEYVRSVPPSAASPLTGSIDASQVTTGVLADARVPASNVTQHQAALSIDWLQLDNVPATFTPAAHVHAAGDVTSGAFADARIAQSSVTQHQAALAILESQVTDGAILARLAAGESVSGQWAFTTRRLDSSASASTASIWFQTKVLADDATDTFAGPLFGLVAVILHVGSATAHNGLFWVSSGSETTASINAGANFSLGTNVNPDIDGNVNAWMSASGVLSVKNRFGLSRSITVIGFGSR